MRDDSGGVIPGATILVVNEATGHVLDLFSDEQGAYQAPALEPGPYRDETTLDGFEPVVRRVVFGAGQKNSNDVVLSPARFSQLDEDYFDLLSAAPGNTGLYVGHREMDGRCDTTRFGSIQVKIMRRESADQGRLSENVVLVRGQLSCLGEHGSWIHTR